jgi:hypothetical protein
VLPVPSPHNSADVTTSGVYENSGIGVRIQSERVYENPRNPHLKLLVGHVVGVDDRPEVSEACTDDVRIIVVFYWSDVVTIHFTLPRPVEPGDT